MKKPKNSKERRKEKQAKKHEKFELPEDGIVRIGSEPWE